MSLCSWTYSRAILTLEERGTQIWLCFRDALRSTLQPINLTAAKKNNEPAKPLLRSRDHSRQKEKGWE